MIIFIDIYIYIWLYIYNYIYICACTHVLGYCIVTLAGRWRSNMYEKGMALWANAKISHGVHFFVLGCCNISPQIWIIFLVFIWMFLKGLCQEAFGNIFFSKEECCTVWKSLWRVLPTGLVLHPLMQMNIIVMIQHCWRNQYTIQNTVMNPITNLYQVVLRISEECSTMFLSFPKEYYALVSI